MWATWAQNNPDLELIKQVLAAKTPEARAAAASVVRFAYDKIPNATELLTLAARDPHPRVRLEAIVAGSWLDNVEGVGVVLEALKQPLDTWMGPVTKQILDHTLKEEVEIVRAGATPEIAEHPNVRDFLAGKFVFPEAPKTDAQKNFGPTRTLEDEDLRMYRIGKEVYLRDAHCVTCHQADGRGTPGVYPPLAGSDWLDDDERLIKITLKGLWGPIEVSGQHFDPTRGVPPMMGFGEMLNDIEMAAVLTYVRQSFGNNGNLVTAEQVGKVREATRQQVNFYTAEELLKQHPLKRQ
jgi:mono/diheme cytochrome c family protein